MNKYEFTRQEWENIFMKFLNLRIHFTGIKVLTLQKKTPPHFENAQNAPKKNNQKSAPEP
jgi:hypothetical protein